MQYRSNVGAHGTIKEEAASSCKGQFSPPKNVGKGVRGWQGLRHGKGGFSCLADVNFFKGMPCTQCKVLEFGKYSNPSFGPFSQVFGSVPGFFWLPKHLGCGIFELSTISP